MGIDLDKLRKELDNITQEEIDKYFPKYPKQKGWISIEEHLPMMLAMDVMIGGSEYKVCYEDGREGISMVSDHNTWYYYAKEVGITHWWNE